MVKHLIIGFGAAGATAAEAIRREQEQAEITILNGEGTPFYLRLDLEKILNGESTEEIIPYGDRHWEDKNIRLLNDRAVRILPDKKIVETAVEEKVIAEAGVSPARPERKTVETAGGETLSYDSLLIASGAKPRKLNVSGEDLKGVHTYRTLKDAQRILNSRESVKRAVIIGGGILGMELARAAVNFGWRTTLLVREAHAGSPLLDKSGGEFILKAMHRKGVGVIFGDEVLDFQGKGEKLAAVRTKGGRTLEADFAGVCIGVVPHVDFLEESSLLREGKLIVDASLKAAEHIFAAGDCAVVETGERRIGCSSWNIAVTQARTAAANMCGGDAVWSPGVVFNTDAFFDQEFVMIGDWQRRHEVGFRIHDFSTEERFRQICTFDGVIRGAMLIGSREGDRKLRRLITDGAKLDENIKYIFSS